MILLRESSMLLTCLTIFSISGKIICAAPVGVGALLSETKSQIVKSTSCPTPETTGVLQEKIAIASFSSLKAHKSSIEPPPLINTMTSVSGYAIFSAFFNDCKSSTGALSPWTEAGIRIIFAEGNLNLAVFIKSLTAAPVGEVIKKTLLGIRGNAFL